MYEVAIDILQMCLLVLLSITMVLLPNWLSRRGWWPLASRVAEAGGESWK